MDRFMFEDIPNVFGFLALTNRDGNLNSDKV